MIMARSILALVATLLVVAACGRPSYYLLPPPSGAARLPSPVATISVADISLPSYAAASEIALLSDDGSVDLNNRTVWADDPVRAMTRHLVAALEGRLTARVGAEPWPGLDPPGLRVEVFVDRLIGSAETGIEMTGQFVIVTPSSGRLYASERFALRTPPQGDGVQGLMSSQARILDLLADEIAARIAGRRPSPTA